MYRLNDKYVKVSEYELSLVGDYILQNKNTLDVFISQVSELDSYLKQKDENIGKYIEIEAGSPIITYILEMYKDKINLQMLQNSIMCSIINLENEKKAELEFLYKAVIATSLRSNIDENKIILNLLSDKDDLYRYIICTQEINDYIKDKNGKQKILKHLKKY